MARKGYYIKGLCLLMGMSALGLYEGAPTAQAQATDPAALERLGQIQDSQDQRRIALEAAQQQAAIQAQRAHERQRQQAATAAAHIAAQRQARSDAKWEDDRRYLEASRSIDLEEQRLKLKMLESRAARSDAFVDADLAQKQAETDRIRQVTAGDQKLKADIGQATKMSQRHWYEFGGD